jgi:hypothetical protein
MLSQASIVTTPDKPRIERGANVPADAELAVVVMAIEGDARVMDGIASLLAQDVPIEIALVNTGTPSLRPRLVSYLDRIVLVEADIVRKPGGTRNLGIEATTAPIVAFLAADCIASPGWATSRLSAHGRGHRAVASALRPAADATGHVPAASWATYALLHVRRAPEFPGPYAARYGTSYQRSLFGEHGLFREDLRIGEDTDFNARITLRTAIAWAPDVVTLHHYPKSTGRALQDAVERGGNTYSWFAANARYPIRLSLKRAFGSWFMARKLVRFTSGEARAALRRAAPLIGLFAIAYGYGAVAAALRDRLRRRRPT